MPNLQFPTQPNDIVDLNVIFKIDCRGLQMNLGSVVGLLVLLRFYGGVLIFGEGKSMQCW